MYQLRLCYMLLLDQSRLALPDQFIDLIELDYSRPYKAFAGVWGTDFDNVGASPHVSKTVVNHTSPSAVVYIVCGAIVSHVLMLQLAGSDAQLCQGGPIHRHCLRFLRAGTCSVS